MANRQDRKVRHEHSREAGVRGQRIEELFREELNSLLDSEMGDPKLDGTRVTLVELSRDGSRARVWFSIRPTQFADQATRTQRALERAAGFLRARLCEALPLKRMPDLKFHFDPVVSVLGDTSTKL